MKAQVQKNSGNNVFIIALVGIVLAGGGFIWWKTQEKPVVVVEMPTVADSALASKEDIRSRSAGGPRFPERPEQRRGATENHPMCVGHQPLLFDRTS